MLYAIIKIVSSDEKDYLNELYQDWFPMLYKISKAILHNETQAQDAATDAMLSLFSLVPKLQAMEEWERVAYLKAIVRNAAYKRYKADKYRHLTKFVPIEDHLFTLPASEELEPEFVLLKNEEYEQVRKAIATLPEKDRIVLHLKYAAQLSAQEIMEMTNAPSVEAVNTQLSRARKKVLRLLEDGGMNA